jgi:hypothetical protein
MSTRETQISICHDSNLSVEQMAAINRLIRQLIHGLIKLPDVKIRQTDYSDGKEIYSANI